MTRRKSIWLAIIVAVLIALGIVWETVPYVRYILIPVTGGTEAPKTLGALWHDSRQPQYGRANAQRLYAEYRPQLLQSVLEKRKEEHS